MTDVAILVLASTMAALILDRLEVPAGLIIGSALVSAILGLAGIVHGAAPQAAADLSNVVLGIMIAGSLFQFFSVAELKQSLADGFSVLCHRPGRFRRPARPSLRRLPIFPSPDVAGVFAAVVLKR